MRPIDGNKWRRFWSPDQADVRTLRQLVANPEAWEFERRVHTDLLFRATTVPLLRYVVEPPLCGNVSMELVEIGVGVGRLAGPLSERRSPRNVTGVDISAAMLAECAKDWPRVVRKPIPVEGAPWGEDIAEVSPADVVYSLLCLQHVPTYELIDGHLRQAWHALRRHGVLRVQTMRSPPNPAIDEPAFHGATFTSLAAFAWAVEGAGFVVQEAVEGLGCDNWLWITAVKP